MERERYCILGTFSIYRKIPKISLEISIGSKNLFHLTQIPFVPRLHSRAILRPKIKDVAANSLEHRKSFQRKNGTFHLGSKWNTTFRVVPASGKFPGSSNGTSEEVVLFFRWKLSDGNSCSIYKLHQFSVNGKRPGLPFQTFCCSRKFSTGTTRKAVFHLLSNRNFRNVLVNGKRLRSQVCLDWIQNLG